MPTIQSRAPYPRGFLLQAVAPATAAPSCSTGQLCTVALPSLAQERRAVSAFPALQHCHLIKSESGQIPITSGLQDKAFNCLFFLKRKLSVNMGRAVVRVNLCHWHVSLSEGRGHTLEAQSCHVKTRWLGSPGRVSTATKTTLRPPPEAPVATTSHITQNRGQTVLRDHR